MTCTSIERKAKHAIIARRRAIAIFTTVHRRSSRCSRNGFDVSLSGNSRNLKMSCNAMSRSVRAQRNQTASSKSRANSKCVGIANLILRDHPAQLRGGNRATFKNRLALLALVDIGSLNPTGQENIAMLVGNAGPPGTINQANQLAAGCQVVARL